MRKIVIASFLLVSVSLAAIPGHAGVIRGLFVGGMAAGASAAQGGSANEVFDAFGSGFSDVYSVASSLFKIFNAKLNKNSRSVKFFIDRFYAERLYNELVKHLEGEDRQRLIIEQEKWRKSGMDAYARKLIDQNVEKPVAYEQAAAYRRQELQKLWDSLGIPQPAKEDMFAGVDFNININNTQQNNPQSDPRATDPAFILPVSGKEICGDVISNLPFAEDANLVIMYVDGESAAYLTDDPLCRKMDSYLCSTLGEGMAAPEELKESGVEADVLYELQACKGR